MPAVQVVLFVWLVVRAVQRGLWNSVSVGSGAQSVIRAGVVVMLQWCASSWDSREQVTCSINTTSIIAVITLIILINLHPILTTHY